MPSQTTSPVNSTPPLTGFRRVWIVFHSLTFLCLVITIFAMPIFLPIVMAGSQAWQLRDILGRARGWAIATFLGVLLGYGCGGWLWIELDRRAIPGVIAIVLGLGLFGICASLPQWWVLRQAGGQAPWRWILTSAVAWVVLGAIYVIAAMSESLLIIGGGVLLAGASYGAVTGPVLLRIVQRLPQAVSNDQAIITVPPL